MQILDNTASAQHHLYKSLLKSKSFLEHPDVPVEIKQQGPIAKDPATLNVQARLCKANQVQDVLAPAVREIYDALGIQAEQSAPAKKRRRRAKDFEGANVKVDETRDDRHSIRNGSGQSHEPELPRANSGEVASESEDDVAGMDKRVALSADSNGDTSDVAEKDQRLSRESVAQNPPVQDSRSYDLATDLSILSSDSAPPSPSPEPQKAPSARKTAFIPSLTMGGYISGSGSDIDDDIDVEPKKNRRGQRARRQIWEQKYGWNAKHLQREGGGRDSGWDPRRGATNGSGGRRGVRRGSPDYSIGAKAVAEAGAAKAGGGERKETERKKARERDDSGPIHPSWEAAKKAKERKEVPVAFQGKKITFD